MSNAANTPPSLLYPRGRNSSASTGRAISTAYETDLGLHQISEALDYDGRHGRYIRVVLTELNSDPATIGYRQDVLQDFLERPALVEAILKLMPSLGELASLAKGRGWGDNIPLGQLAVRLAELDVYLSCVEGLAAAVETAKGFRSAGLLALQKYLKEVQAEPLYTRLLVELPELRRRLGQAKSVTIGINLDAQLKPEAATILSINPERFSGRSRLLERLFNTDNGETVRSIGGLYRTSEGHAGRELPEHELYREMARLIEETVGPIVREVARYTRINSTALGILEPELAFFIGATRLTNRVRTAGLSLCRPRIAEPEERLCSISGVYNLELALGLIKSGQTAKVVPNEVEFGPDAAIFILTGPNSGGKTTYTRAVGQAQVLFQAGLLVPGENAVFSPVEAIFTHFASVERSSSEANGGRLAQELEQLARIFNSASRTSLVLLNEPLASTDHTSARLLSRDIVAGLQVLGARTIYVTHIHELVEDVVALGLEDGAARSTGLVSLVAGLVEGEGDGSLTTYKIRPGRPHSQSYAAELARRYGLDLSQITAVLRQRGMLD